FETGVGNVNETSVPVPAAVPQVVVPLSPLAAIVPGSEVATAVDGNSFVDGKGHALRPQPAAASSVKISRCISCPGAGVGSPAGAFPRQRSTRQMVALVPGLLMRCRS